MSRSPSKVPVPKVVAAGLGAAAATVVVVTIQAITGGEIPTGLEGALATLLAFAAGYITPPAGIGEDTGADDGAGELADDRADDGMGQ